MTGVEIILMALVLGGALFAAYAAKRHDAREMGADREMADFDPPLVHAVRHAYGDLPYRHRHDEVELWPVPEYKPKAR